jgi:hypothetical protein
MLHVLNGVYSAAYAKREWVLIGNLQHCQLPHIAHTLLRRLEYEFGTGDVGVSLLHSYLYPIGRKLSICGH